MAIGASCSSGLITTLLARRELAAPAATRRPHFAAYISRLTKRRLQGVAQA